MNDNNVNINSFLTMDEEELFYELGIEIYMSSGNINPSLKKRKSLIELSKKWFNKSIKNLKSNICKSEVIKKYQSEPDSFTEIELISAIGDFLMQNWSLPAPFVIATLLFKSGINNICNE